MKKKLLLLLLFLVVTAGAVKLLRPAPAYEVRSFGSPDGRYVVEVYAFKESFSAPGDSGQGAGYVLLRRAGGEVMRKKEVDGVGVIEFVYWFRDRVEIKLFDSWELESSGVE